MIATYYMQVVSLGLVWTFVHCSGMCGPLVAGLTSRPGDRGTRARRIWLRARRVAAYQAGRAVTYATLGALAGLLGAAFEGTIRDAANAAGFAIAPVFAVMGARRLLGRPAPTASSGGVRIASWSMGALRELRRHPALRGDLIASLLTGVVMGLLPCMLMFWVLGVAATTASALHGAGVMLTLIALTTPTLLAAGCAMSFWRSRWSEPMVGAALLGSAVWMMLVTMAANGWIAHAHLTFELRGEPFMLMFF